MGNFSCFFFSPISLICCVQVGDCDTLEYRGVSPQYGSDPHGEIKFFLAKKICYFCSASILSAKNCETVSILKYFTFFGEVQQENVEEKTETWSFWFYITFLFRHCSHSHCGNHAAVQHICHSQDIHRSTHIRGSSPGQIQIIFCKGIVLVFIGLARKLFGPTVFRIRNFFVLIRIPGYVLLLT